MYDETPLNGMSQEIFNNYKKFKQESKILTTSESLKNGLQIILNEFNRMIPIISKDPKRLHDIDQKRILYFRQKGLCPECGKEMRFEVTSSHHGVAHSNGGRTDDLENAVILHVKCHQKLEKRMKKGLLDS